MGALSAIIGVADSTNPGGKLTTPPFADSFTRADGDPGQPWFNPRCDNTILQVTSDTLQAPNENAPACRAAVLLDSGDIDVTFTVSFSAYRAGVRDDVQLWFRADPCTPPTSGYATDAIGVTMQPNTDPGLTGSTGVSVYRQAGLTVTQTAFRDTGTINEGDTHTIRVVASGTTLDVFVDGLVFLSTTIDLLPGQTAAYFVADKLLSTIDDVSFATPSTAPFTDTFDRANSSSSMGGAWTALVGTWGIDSDTAYLASSVAGSVNGVIIDTGLGDGTIQVDVPAFWGSPPNGGLGIAFRVVDINNLYIADFGSTAPQLFKGVGGSYTSLGTFAGGVLASGDTIIVVLAGSSITIKRLRAGVLSTLLSVTDATYDNSHHKHGFYMFSQDFTSRLDNFAVS